MINIFCVDDEERILRTFARTLQGSKKLSHLQATIHTFDDPVTAVAAYHELKPKVIILDIMMPGLMGEDFLTAIGWQPGCGVGIVVASAYDKTAPVLGRLRNQGVIVLGKPVFPISTLCDAVLMALEHEGGIP